MSNILQRYEAAVKLNNNKVVVYHNINTGLFKFHRFINEKFAEKWIYYTVRRKENKEIIDTFRNDIQVDVRAVRISLPKQRNIKNSGFFVRFPFERSGVILNRNLFFADKIVLEYSEEWIIIPNKIFDKAVLTAIQELKNYLIEQGQLVAEDEIRLMPDDLEKILTKRSESIGTQPTKDYP